MSVLDELRARREQLRTRDRHLDYEVPGYDGDLVIRFNPAPYETVHRYQTSAGDAERELEVDTDVIVESCREFLVKEDDGKLAPIKEGETTTFATADEVFGFESDTVRATVLEIFPSKLAVSEAASHLVVWSRAIDYEVDEKLEKELGKPSGGRSSSGPPVDSTSA